MHLKRNNIGKFWPIARKGTKYLACPDHNHNISIPLVIAVRDIFKFVENKRELKRLLNEKKIQINHKIVRETNYPICLFDIVTFSDTKKNYKALLSKDKKIIFEEVHGKDSESKIYKVLSRKMLPGKVIQINFNYGRNIISKEKMNIGDSAVFNLKENKIEKIIPVEKGKKVFITDGKHAGHSGTIEEIVERGGKQIAKIKSGKGKINVWTKNIIATD